MEHNRRLAHLGVPAGGVVAGIAGGRIQRSAIAELRLSDGPPDAQRIAQGADIVRAEIRDALKRGPELDGERAVAALVDRARLRGAVEERTDKRLARSAEA